jgi:hypothetical protein
MAIVQLLSPACPFLGFLDRLSCSSSNAYLFFYSGPVNVDPWLTPDSSYKLNDTIKPLQRLRKTVHIKPSQNRSWKPTEFEGTSEKKIRKSIIPKLKNLLQKLESPEKNN